MTLVTVRDVTGQDFIQTARAKGMSEGRVMRRHGGRSRWRRSRR